MGVECHADCYVIFITLTSVMLKYEASIDELFFRSCTADKSSVPQGDRKIGYCAYKPLLKTDKQTPPSPLCNKTLT